MTAIEIESDEVATAVARAKTWSVAGRIALMKGVLETLTQEPSGPSTLPRGPSSDEIRTLFKSEKPAPDDETVRRWIDEYRMEKYG